MNIDLLFAVCLLLCPKGTETEECWGYLGPQVVLVASEWGLATPAEVMYFFNNDSEEGRQGPVTWASQPGGGYDQWRGWREDLLDAPPVEQAAMLPDKDYCGAVRATASAFESRLRLKQQFDTEVRWGYWQPAIEDAHFAWQAWDYAYYAKMDYQDTRARRWWLKSLRELIGERAYYAVDLPPPIPLYEWKK